jgi:hypothetical protein
MTVQLKRNDTKDTISYKVTNKDGSVVNLTGATVRFVMGKGKNLITNSNATIVNAVSGDVSYTLTDSDTLAAGTFNAEFEVTFSDGKVKTYPSNGYILVNIQANVDKDQSTYIEDQIAYRVSDIQVLKNSVQAQLDEFAKGDSSPEVAQARIEADNTTNVTLKARLDKKEAKFTADIATLTTNMVQRALKTDLDTTNSNVTLKADKTYVDTITSSLASGSPKGTYATLAALQTAFPTGNTNIYLVTADGKWYYWSGSAWTAGGTYQATGIGEKNVKPINTTFIEEIIGKNKLNPADINASFYYSPSNVRIQNRGAVANCVTGFTEVVEGETYLISGTHVSNSGGYFASGAVMASLQAAISNITFTTVAGGFRFTVPTGSNIKYVVINLIYDTNTNTVPGTYQMEIGTMPTAIESYKKTHKVINLHTDAETLMKMTQSAGGISNDMFQSNSITPDKTSFMEAIPKKNMINPDDIDKAFYYSPGGAAISSASGATVYAITGLIEVEEGEWYVYSGSAFRGSGGYFGENAVKVAGQSAISSITFTAPVDSNGLAFQVPLNSGIKYVALNLGKNATTQEIEGSYQLEKGEQATAIEPYEIVELIKNEHLPKGNLGNSGSSALDNSSWFAFLEGVSYGDITDKIPKFYKHWINRDKNLVVAMTGTSLTARSTEHSTDHIDKASRPPLMHSNNFASLAWDKMKWDGQQYRRYDYAGFFTETGTFVTQSNIPEWDDGAYRHGLTRYADTAGNVKFVVPIDAWQFNFIYRSDSVGSEAVNVSIAEGNGQMEVWNGTAWVEANGYIFSMKETPITLSNITAPEANSKDNGLTRSFATYQVGGNTTYQKRLKMRCKSATIDSRTTVKNVTISASTGRLLYWGVEWSPREHMITFVNASRGSHNVTIDSSTALYKFQDNEIWSFKPDLIFTENPIHNSGAGGKPSTTYFTEWWANLTNNFFFNTQNPVSMRSRAVANGVTEPEWIVFNSTLAWNFGAIADDGSLIVAPNKDNKMITAMDAQMMAHQWIKENEPNVISINAIRYWVHAGQKVFGDLKSATVGSGKGGNTFTNEGSHWNDTGSKVMAKCILPIFDFTI